LIRIVEIADDIGNSQSLDQRIQPQVVLVLNTDDKALLGMQQRASEKNEKYDQALHCRTFVRIFM
jgi:hypothetical protein